MDMSICYNCRMFLSITCYRRLPRLTLFTKSYCPLCDDAVREIEHLKDRFEFEQILIDKSGNEKYFHKYKFDIPVFHLEKRFLMQHRADPELLENELDKYESSS